MRGARRGLACAAAIALLALAQLRLLVVHTDTKTSVPRATVLRPTAAEVLPPPLPPTVLPTAADGVALDARYPAEVAYGSARRGPPPWLVALRKQLLSDNGGKLPPIPQRLHQTWKDANPPRVLFSPRWSRSLRAQNTGWEYRLWTDAENRALVASHHPSLLSMYDGYESPIQRADMARYVIAHAHGGVYADLDTECFRPFSPLLRGASLVLSYKLGANFSRGACNSIFASAKGHPFWDVVFDVARNRSSTPLSLGHRAVLYSTGPAVLREAVRRLLRLPEATTLTEGMMGWLKKLLGMHVLDAKFLHPVTAERRNEDDATTRPPEAVCTHHFVSSWVAHNKDVHESTEKRRQAGDATAAMHGLAQPVARENAWADGVARGAGGAASRPTGRGRGGGAGGRSSRGRGGGGASKRPRTAARTKANG